MRAVFHVLALVPLSLLVACTSPEVGTATATEQTAVADAAATRRAIDDANRRAVEAFNRGDIAGFARIYTDDARILPPEMQTIEGRDAIQRFWEGGVQQMGIRDLRLTTTEIEIAGDRAYETGVAEFRAGETPVRSKFMVFWKREPDGSWKWHRDIWNFDPAPGT